MSDERLTALENKVFAQDNAITELNHKFDLELCKITSELTKIDESQTELKSQVKTMDDELKISFKDRDDKIVDLQIESAKVNTRQLIYASVVFTAISVAVRFI